MDRLRIAVIGIGHDHSVFVINSLRKQRELFDLAGFYLPPEEEKAFPEKLACLEGLRRLTLEQLLEDPSISAVAVESEEKSLTHYATLAARHGKHIHMDKPGAPVFEAFQALVSLVRERKLVFHLGYMYRYNPAVQKLMADVKAGKLGQIFSVEAQMNCRHTPQKRQWLAEFPGGMMFFLGCHLVDLAVQLRGFPQAIHPYNRSTGLDGVTALDYGMAVLDYPNGVSLVKTCANELGGFARRQLVISGETGTVELKPFEMYEVLPEHYTGVTEYRNEAWNDMGMQYKTDTFDRYDDMLAAFREMALGQKENPWSYDYELKLFQTILACCGGEAQ